MHKWKLWHWSHGGGVWWWWGIIPIHTCVTLSTSCVVQGTLDSHKLACIYRTVWHLADFSQGFCVSCGMDEETVTQYSECNLIRPGMCVYGGLNQDWMCRSCGLIDGKTKTNPLFKNADWLVLLSLMMKHPYLQKGVGESLFVIDSWSALSKIVFSSAK